MKKGANVFDIGLDGHVGRDDIILEGGVHSHELCYKCVLRDAEGKFQ